MCSTPGTRRSLVGALFICSALVAGCHAPQAQAETRRAVIVGINKYVISGELPPPGDDPPDPRLWRNLRGARNDAVRIADLLVASYGFDRNQIVTLYDDKAKREAILGALEEHLVRKSQPGDVAFFFYAGHGSLVKNSLSANEQDQLDESLVPADSMHGKRDIRDKELRDVFNRILDRKAKLTAILDSCHSGSISRGPAGDAPVETRKLAIDTRDVKDASRAPDPASRGALIFSAAQNDQVAVETKDEFNQPGGLFSIALMRALRNARPDESAQNLHRRIKASMADAGLGQEPVLEGSDERRSASLFGTATNAGTGKTVAAVTHVDGANVTLQEGVAAGLTARTELARIGGTPVRLRIETVDSIVTSRATVIAGDAASVKVGDLFVVDRWARQQTPSLEVWMPTTTASISELSSLHRTLRDAVVGRGHRWLSDPVDAGAVYVIAFAGGKWSLWPPTGDSRNLGATPTAAALQAALSDAPANAPVFMALPLPIASRGVVVLGEGTDNSAIAVAETPDADYHLMGRIASGMLAYSWVRPWALRKTASTLPARTDWIEFPSADPRAAGNRLSNKAVGLGRINAWLELEPPAAGTRFRYRLALQPATGEPVFEGTAREGDRLSLVLLADTPNASGVASRFVYAFYINTFGECGLMFPRAAAVENRFPPAQDEASPQQRYPLAHTGFTVEGPFGKDTIFMISTAQQLSDPTVLNCEAVRTRGPEEEGPDPLSVLLESVSSNTRSPRMDAVPVDWSIERISLSTSSR